MLGFTNLSNFVTCFRGAPFVFLLLTLTPLQALVGAYMVVFHDEIRFKVAYSVNQCFFFCNVRSQQQSSASCQFFFLMISNKSISVGLIVFSTSETFIEVECF